MMAAAAAPPANVNLAIVGGDVVVAFLPFVPRWHCRPSSGAQSLLA